MINNRQAGRRRGRGGSGGNNGQRGGNGGNGSRIDNRARGNATQLHEKYKNMAADAQRAGDRVNTEYYLQFADHYFRVLSEQRGRFEEQQPRRGRDEFDLDGDEEYGDEGEPVRAREQWNDGEGQREERGEGQDRQRDDRQRDDRPRGEREDRPRGDRPERSPDRGRDDRGGERQPREFRREANGDAQGGARRERGEWQDRPRERRPEPVAEQLTAPVEIAGQRRAEPLGAGESLEGRAEEVLEADRPLDAPPARRRGRPRREAEPVVQDGAESNGFEADRLPPSLTLAANDEAPAEPKPRRPRRPRVTEDTPTAAE